MPCSNTPHQTAGIAVTTRPHRFHRVAQYRRTGIAYHPRHPLHGKGIGKLVLNEAKLKEDLDANWAVVAEAIQTILRREITRSPTRTLKELTGERTESTSNPFTVSSAV